MPRRTTKPANVARRRGAVPLVARAVLTACVIAVARAHEDGRSRPGSGLADARGDAWMTTGSSLRSMTTDAERCRARAWGAVIDAGDGVGACEALVGVGGSSGMRCEAASASARCRLERAGARARSGACAERGDGCERCVLRALGRARDVDAGGDDETEGDDAVGGFMLDRGIEFAVYSEESAAIDRDCKHYVAVWRAELAANAIAALSTRLVEAQEEANERAEAITSALTSLDADVHAQADAMRALRSDVSAAETATREAAATVDALRMRQRAFASDFERFASSTMDAIVRMERASSGLLAVARFGAATAQSCVRVLTWPFTMMRVIEVSVLRFAILIIGVYDRRIRVDAATTLAIDWIISSVESISTTVGLRIAIACAFLARLVRHTTKLPIDFGASPEPKRRRRSTKPMKSRSTRAPAPATRSSARIKSKSTPRGEDVT